MQSFTLWTLKLKYAAVIMIYTLSALGKKNPNNVILGRWLGQAIMFSFSIGVRIFQRENINRSLLHQSFIPRGRKDCKFFRSQLEKLGPSAM